MDCVQSIQLSSVSRFHKHFSLMSFLWSRIQARETYYTYWSFLFPPVCEFLSLALLPKAPDLKGFEEHWLGILENVPKCEFPQWFLTIRLRLCAFGKKTTEVMLCPSQCITSGGSQGW